MYLTGSRKRAAGQGAAPAPASTPRPRTEAADDDDEEETRRHFWIEPDARSLDCAICLMPFEAEVYMCTNGHAACARCCLRINRKCWCCGEPIGDVRCRPLENLLADLNTPCKFQKYGCCESVRYAERRAHEDACPRAPYACPLGGCSYRGIWELLYQHLAEDHADAVTDLRTTTVSTKVTVHKRTPLRVLVPPRRSCVFLLLNGGDVLGGRCLSLVCLGPRPEGNAEISYKMEVRGGEPGALTLSGTAPCVRDLDGFQAKKFIFVPDADWGSSGTVSVSVRVG